MERDSEDQNREQPAGGADAETDRPADGPGGAESDAGATSQDEPGAGEGR